MGYDADSRRAVAFGRTVDWVLAALLGIAGTLVALAGVALYRGFDRPDVAEALRRSEFESEVLTASDAVDAFAALADWGGIGLMASGALVALLGVAVVVGHGRARRDGRGTPTWVVGVVGASISSALGFVPFSPVLGGLAAGYLDPNPDASGLGTGTVAGVFGCLPVLVTAVFAGVGLFVGLPADVAASVVVPLAVGLALSLVYFVGPSALGGYLGGWLREG
jgi:hypothetical protein